MTRRARIRFVYEPVGRIPKPQRIAVLERLTQQGWKIDRARIA